MTPMEKALAHLRLACLSGTYMGLISSAQDRAYLARCRVSVRSGDIITIAIYTRDVGHHESGWWKNPDYERCRHLSVSFHYVDGTPAPFRAEKAVRWARALFGHDTRWVWVEPPYTPEGKEAGVHHYRLFCDLGWNPIKPRGEVYSKEFTEAGWKSFSEIHGARAADFEAPIGSA